ncbi:MAG: hypothetical protein CMF39_04295 [Legionellaceae bacterium]|nr:hypothetical protein [Legionellaceae bacterium]
MADAFTGGPFELVRTNNVSGLKQRLDAGLLPNTCDKSGRSLLEMAIRYGHIAVSALLVYNNADPNKCRIVASRQVPAIDDLFIPGHYCESLAKFILTYNGRFHYWFELLKNTYLEPGNDSDRFLKAALNYSEERYALYNAEKKGKAAYEQSNYVEASKQCEIAVRLLRQFIEEEQIKLDRQSSQVDTPLERQTHIDIIRYYQARRDSCLELIAKCTPFTSDESMGTDSEASEDAPLLGKASADAGVRHRRPFSAK